MLPIWAYGAIALVLTSLGFGAGWKVESWRWGSSETAAVTAAIDATNKANAVAMGALRAEMQRASSFALADQAAQLAIAKDTAKQKVVLINAPLDPEACRPASPRDVAVLGGVRAILTAADPEPGAAGASAAGADSGHPAAGPAGGDHDAGPARPGDARPGGVGDRAASALVPSPGLGQRLREVIGR